MPLEKSPIRISIGAIEFEFATITETISFLRGIEHAMPARRRRAKAVDIKERGKG